jgi:hypothetical protein
MDIMKYLRAQWDRALSVAIAVAAAISLLLGYRGVSGTPHVAVQLPYIVSAGLFGIFLLTIAATLWVSADLRDEWRELRRLRVRLDRIGDPDTLPLRPQRPDALDVTEPVSNDWAAAEVAT